MKWTVPTLMIPGTQVRILVNGAQDKTCRYKLVLFQKRKTKQIKVRFPRNCCIVKTHVPQPLIYLLIQSYQTGTLFPLSTLQK
jgi:hypothetical protein